MGKHKKILRKRRPEQKTAMQDFYLRGKKNVLETSMGPIH